MKPLDILVGLKAHLWRGDDAWSFERLATSLGITASQAHTSLRRLAEAGLYRPTDRSLRTHAFGLFAEHGIPFVFPAQPGARTVGMPTAHAAPPLRDLLASADAFVWPAEVGVAGRAVVPLHPRAPAACADDDALYRALALVDALRVGRARDRQIASEELSRVLAEPDRDAVWSGERLGARRAS